MKSPQAVSDGACTGYPGPGGFGYVIFLDGQNAEDNDNNEKTEEN